VRASIPLTFVLSFAALTGCSSANPVQSGPELDPGRSADADLDTRVERSDLDSGSVLDGAVDASAIAPRGAVEAGPPTREHAVLRRTCERTPFGSDYQFFPTSMDCGPNCRTGTECASSQDCTARGAGDCIGLLGARCEYGGVPGASDDVCSLDEHCTRGAMPRCPREVRYSFCLYGTCRSHADCAADERCECPTGGNDPVCVLLGCDRDEDCPASQTCRVDESYGGVANRRHCSTPADSCASEADCGQPGLFCGFDRFDRRWLCREYAIID